MSHVSYFRSRKYTLVKQLGALRGRRRVRRLLEEREDVRALGARLQQADGRAGPGGVRERERVLPLPRGP